MQRKNNHLRFSLHFCSVIAWNIMLVAFLNAQTTTRSVKVTLLNCDISAGFHLVVDGDESNWVLMKPEKPEAKLLDSDKRQLNMEDTPASLRLNGSRTPCVRSVKSQNSLAASFTFRCNQIPVRDVTIKVAPAELSSVYVRSLPSGDTPCDENGRFEEGVASVADMRLLPESVGVKNQTSHGPYENLRVSFWPKEPKLPIEPCGLLVNDLARAGELENGLTKKEAVQRYDAQMHLGQLCQPGHSAPSVEFFEKMVPNNFNMTVSTEKR